MSDICQEEPLGTKRGLRTNTVSCPEHFMSWKGQVYNIAVNFLDDFAEF